MISTWSPCTRNYRSEQYFLIWERGGGAELDRGGIRPSVAVANHAKRRGEGANYSSFLATRLHRNTLTFQPEVGTYAGAVLM